MKNEIFQEFKEKILAIDPFLPIADFEKLVNEIFHKLQNQLKIGNPKIDLVNLFVTALKDSEQGKVVDTENLILPAGLNLSALKTDSSAKDFAGFINIFASISNIIVDPKTRELILMPLLMQNFSKPIDLDNEMFDLIDGLRCTDNSRPTFDKNSLKQVSSELMSHLRLFQPNSLSENFKQMSLSQMFGILQSVSNLKSFGFTLKQPKEIGSCDESYFADNAYQFPRFGLNDKMTDPRYCALWSNTGEIKFDQNCISKTYLVYHEVFHMFLYDKKYSFFNLKHFDDFKFLNPLLNLKEFIPLTILTKNYPYAIPKNYTRTEDIGVIDLLFTATTRNLGRPFNLPDSCNQKLRNPGDIFKNFCPDKMAPKLFMETLYNKNLIDIEREKAFNEDLSKILRIECFTAISAGIFHVFLRCLSLSEHNKKALQSLGENGVRLALIATSKNIDETFNIAIFSGLITLAKIADLIISNCSSNYSSENLMQKIGEATIGKRETDNIEDSIKAIPKIIKKLSSQTFFVFSMYLIDELVKDSQKKDKFGDTNPRIDQKILIGFLASLSSAFIGSIFEIVANKMLKNERRTAPNPNPVNPRVEEHISAESSHSSREFVV